VKVKDDDELDRLKPSQLAALTSEALLGLVVHCLKLLVNAIHIPLVVCFLLSWIDIQFDNQHSVSFTGRLRISRKNQLEKL
jgi:hypothetical protein